MADSPASPQQPPTSTLSEADIEALTAWCVDIGRFKFPSVDVLFASCRRPYPTAGLITELRDRHILLTEEDLTRVPGPDPDDVSPTAFLGPLTAALSTSVATTTDWATWLVSGAATWGSWLVTATPPPPSIASPRATPNEHGTVIFRPALHRQAAALLQAAVSSIQERGALARLFTADEWEELLVESRVLNPKEMTDFLIWHVGVVQPLKAPHGEGVLLRVAFTTDSDAAWTDETATLLLDFIAQLKALDDCLAAWEGDLADVPEDDKPDHVAERARLERLITANKLMQIELRKLRTRVEHEPRLAPEEVRARVEERLAFFPDVARFPIRTVAELAE